MTQKSKGHMFFTKEFEFFRVKNQIFRAHRSNPLDIKRYRQGARFECFESSFGLLSFNLKDQIVQE